MADIRRFLQDLSSCIMALSPEELQALDAISDQPEVVGRSCELADWCANIVGAERERRAGQDVRFPVPDVLSWDDDQLGAALVVALGLLESMVSERLDDLARHIVTMLALTAATRLQARHMALSN